MEKYRLTREKPGIELLMRPEVCIYCEKERGKLETSWCQSGLKTKLTRETKREHRNLTNLHVDSIKKLVTSKRLRYTSYETYRDIIHRRKGIAKHSDFTWTDFINAQLTLKIFPLLSVSAEIYSSQIIWHYYLYLYYIWLFFFSGSLSRFATFRSNNFIYDIVSSVNNG